MQFELIYSITLVDYPTNSKEGTPFTITIEEGCLTPVSLVAGAMVDQEYTLATPAVSYTFDEFPSEPNPPCFVTFTYSLNGPAGNPVVLLDGATRTFTFEYLTDLAPLGSPTVEFKDYIVTVNAEIGFTTLITVTTTFNLRLWNPCFDSLLVSISLNPSPFVDETDILGAA